MTPWPIFCEAEIYCKAKALEHFHPIVWRNLEECHKSMLYYSGWIIALSHDSRVRESALSDVFHQGFFDPSHAVGGDGGDRPDNVSEKSAARPLWQLPRVLARWLWLPTWLKPVWLEVFGTGGVQQKGSSSLSSLRFFFQRISEFT